MELEKQFPQNIEAECGVLGSILIDPDAMVQVAHFLKPAHFYRNTHRSIYEEIYRLYERREPADFITICDGLEQKGLLDEVGGAEYITSLINRVPTSGNVEYYARIVERMGLQREVIRFCGEVAKLAYEGNERVIEIAEERLYQLSQGKAGNAIVSHREALQSYWDTLEELHKQQSSGKLLGVPTGYPALDKKLGGWRASKMYILAARPGDGKTAAGENFAYEAAKHNCNVLFFSIEMDQEELMQRLLAMGGQVDSLSLRDAKLNEDEWDHAVSAMPRLLGLPGTIWLDDTPANDIHTMRSKARRMQQENGIDLIIVDYLQLAEAGEEETRRSENRRLEVEKVSRGLKNMARELKVPVLALAQLNRDIESRANRLPQLSDLREAGGIEQDCDVAMFIWRDPAIPKDAKEYNISLMIEKHRNGPKGAVTLHYKAPYTRFYPVTGE